MINIKDVYPQEMKGPPLVAQCWATFRAIRTSSSVTVFIKRGGVIRAADNSIIQRDMFKYVCLLENILGRCRHFVVFACNKSGV